VARRVRSARDSAGNNLYGDDVTKALVRAQYARVLEESTSRRLRVEEGVAGELVAKSMITLSEIDQGIYAPMLFHVLSKPARFG
jgi:hypothetical protein